MSEAETRYCERCGLESADGSDSGLDGHDCVGNAEFEPPRYCRRCRRRMVVQLTPSGWSARCSRHGVIHSDGIVGR